MGESAALLRETGHQSFGKLRTGSKGRKASAPSQTASHVEQVATCLRATHRQMDNESEGVSVRAVMENRPTLARSPVQKIGGRPQKGKVSRPYNHAVYGIHPSGDPVQSPRPFGKLRAGSKATQNLS